MSRPLVKNNELGNVVNIIKWNGDVENKLMSVQSVQLSTIRVSSGSLIYYASSVVSMLLALLS